MRNLLGGDQMVNRHVPPLRKKHLGPYMGPYTWCCSHRLIAAVMVALLYTMTLVAAVLVIAWLGCSGDCCVLQVVLSRRSDAWHLCTTAIGPCAHSARA